MTERAGFWKRSRTPLSRAVLVASLVTVFVAVWALYALFYPQYQVTMFGRVNGSQLFVFLSVSVSQTLSGIWNIRERKNKWTGMFAIFVAVVVFFVALMDVYVRR
ncbi:MAG TPA: hypothetical protein VMV40_02075 [Acidiferrobacter sp.]|nr:hypothetical protein [Acidiferrobacter sp.]